MGKAGASQHLGPRRAQEATGRARDGAKPQKHTSGHLNCEHGTQCHSTHSCQLPTRGHLGPASPQPLPQDGSQGEAVPKSPPPRSTAQCRTRSKHPQCQETRRLSCCIYNKQSLLRPDFLTVKVRLREQADPCVRRGPGTSGTRLASQAGWTEEGEAGREAASDTQAFHQPPCYPSQLVRTPQKR